MVGVAAALGLDLGEIVALNLAYELERIGVTCSNWNNTGPTMGDDAIPRGLSCDPDGNAATKLEAFFEANKMPRNERKISQILESVRSSAKYVDAILADQDAALEVLAGV